MSPPSRLDFLVPHISDGGVSGAPSIYLPGKIDHETLLRSTAVVNSHDCRPIHQGGDGLIVTTSFLRFLGTEPRRTTMCKNNPGCCAFSLAFGDEIKAGLVQKASFKKNAGKRWLNFGRRCAT
jgi:hypothetical protein